MMTHGESCVLQRCLSCLSALRLPCDCVRQLLRPRWVASGGQQSCGAARSSSPCAATRKVGAFAHMLPRGLEHTQGLPRGPARIRVLRAYKRRPPMTPVRRGKPTHGALPQVDIVPREDDRGDEAPRAAAPPAAGAPFWPGGLAPGGPNGALPRPGAPDPAMVQYYLQQQRGGGRGGRRWRARRRARRARAARRKQARGLLTALGCVARADAVQQGRVWARMRLPVLTRRPAAWASGAASAASMGGRCAPLLVARSAAASTWRADERRGRSGGDSGCLRAARPERG